MLESKKSLSFKPIRAFAAFSLLGVLCGMAQPWNHWWLPYTTAICMLSFIISCGVSE